MTTTRLERFLKPKGHKPAPSEESFPENEPIGLYEILRRTGKQSWLNQNHPMLLANFNLFNLEKYPNKGLAKGVATICLKGTTFDDKRENCIDLAQRLENQTDTGEITLIPEPNNIHDPHALAAQDSLGRIVGYIPKAKSLNKIYSDAMDEGKLCGAYIASAKISEFQGKPAAILTLATGWK